MNPRRKNIIVIQTDQLRADGLGCMGNRLARTPVIDFLAARGTLYTNHQSVNPVCTPSRVSFLTSRYPQTHGVRENGLFMPETELTLPAVFKEHGYNTALIGKAHFQPYQHDPVSPSMESRARWKNGELDDWNGPYYGFDHVEITAGHGEQVEGHYGRWREHNFPNLKLRFEGAQDYLRDPEFQCYKSAIPVEAHHSTWVADRAIAAIERQDGTCPFYLQVSFPDPHHPFTPPEPYASMFDDVEFPEPHYVVGENENKPLPWREAMTQSPFEGNGCAHHYPSFRGEVYQAVLAHTHGMIALIDASIGRILTRIFRKKSIVDMLNC